jgi:hypothetical protein
MMNVSKVNLLFYAMTAIGLISAISAQSGGVSVISVTLCGLVNGVRSIIGAVAIVLFLIGGVLYATAHFLPTSLEFRKSLIGWAQAMIVGGIIGLVVVLLAQPIIGLFTGIGQGLGGTLSNTISC